MTITRPFIKTIAVFSLIFTLITVFYVPYQTQAIEGDYIPPVTAPLTAPIITPTGFANHGSNGGGGGSNGGGSSSMPEAPVCSDTPPGSAPYVFSALQTGPNSVTLYWTGAADPVTYYYVGFGKVSQTFIYGSGEFGDKWTSHYTVDGLSPGQTYYLRVRAGNGCKPGAFSNEVKVKVLTNYGG